MQSKNFSFKDFIPYKFFYQIISLAFIVCIIFIAKSFYTQDIKKYKHKVYKSLSINIKAEIENLLTNKLDRIYLTGITLANNQNIKDSLLKHNPSFINIDSILKQLKLEKNLSKCCLMIRDKEGKSFKDIGKFPKVSQSEIYKSGFNTTLQGLFFYSISDIEHNGKKIGSVVIRSHFDDFIEMIKKEGFDSVLLLNKEDSKKIDIDQSRTKNFIEDCYVVNKKSDSYLLKLITQEGIENYYKAWKEPYQDLFSQEYLIIKHPIKQDKKEIANLFLFKKFSDIDTSFENIILFQYISYSFAIIIFIALLIYFLKTKDIVKRLDRDNKILNLENEKLKEKSDQLDYNEKKLENLFNMQPNLMIMHNGYEITSANKRFMGFFNRFGDFDGFKLKHRCVSELFEEYDAPNYIWEQYIEGEFWIDYLLNNPKRLYKTVMSINGDPHHFIIKFNELKYAKYVSERLIIVALVDMTQDLPNYKTLEEVNQQRISET
jgi:hypothetical protein